jgi:uncharacterized protein (DUF2252 family)
VTRTHLDSVVAEAMANGDRISRWPSGAQRVEPATPAQLSAATGLAPVHVKSVQRRIRAQLGWQAC